MEFLSVEGYETLTVRQLMGFIAGGYTPASKAVLITFDDGWLDNYRYAVPVLKAYNFKSTHFLITGRVRTVTVASQSGPLPDHERCKKLIQCGRGAEVTLGWDLVRELDAEPLFEFYSHTVSHRPCADLDGDELRHELARSKRSLEERLGRACDYLCWPYGSYSQSALECAAHLGYKGTFSTIDGFCTKGSDPFLVKRIEVKDSLGWFKDRLSLES